MGGRKVNKRRLDLLREQSATAPHDGGVIVIDDSGDRKDGTATANVGRQWLGRLGKTDNGIVTVTTVWTDGRVYYPLHAQPYTPARPPLHPRPVRPDLPHQTADLRRSHGPGQGGGLRLPGGGRRLRLLRQRRLVSRTTRGWPALRSPAIPATGHR
ncbi:transposase [Streptomyces sp. NBC_01283]|uniref:transposase n=1 Tax=Streptomyces sp. NBC_01283 TaxID=2903812 RepID=UPI00352ECA31|nr:transposase [Streptomyces sp. NBC_01283]